MSIDSYQSSQLCCQTTSLAVFLDIVLLPKSQISHSLVVNCALCSRYDQTVTEFQISDDVNQSFLFIQLLSDGVVGEFLIPSNIWHLFVIASNSYYQLAPVK